jgi:hypothetical protein
MIVSPIVLITATAHGEQPAASPADQGIVYRLSDSDKAELLARQTDRDLATAPQATAKARRAKQHALALAS